MEGEDGMSDCEQEILGAEQLGKGKRDKVSKMTALRVQRQRHTKDMMGQMGTYILL